MLWSLAKYFTDNHSHINSFKAQAACRWGDRFTADHVSLAERFGRLLLSWGARDRWLLEHWCVESLVNCCLWTELKHQKMAHCRPLRAPGTRRGLAVSFGSKGPGQHDRNPSTPNVVACLFESHQECPGFQLLCSKKKDLRMEREHLFPKIKIHSLPQMGRWLWLDLPLHQVQIEKPCFSSRRFAFETDECFDRRGQGLLLGVYLAKHCHRQSPCIKSGPALSLEHPWCGLEIRDTTQAIQYSSPSRFIHSSSDVCRSCLVNPASPAATSMSSLDDLRSCGLPLVLSSTVLLSKVATPKDLKDLTTDAVTENGSDGSVEEVQKAMEGKARSLNLSALLLAVDANPPYYEQSLEWRRDRLSANSVEELCKSVVLENTKLDASSEAGRVRCVLVIVQYVAKLHKEKLIKVVQGMESAKGLPPLGKKQYNMRLLEGTACQKMTGYGHNAVTPLGQVPGLLGCFLFCSLSYLRIWFYPIWVRMLPWWNWELHTVRALAPDISSEKWPSFLDFFGMCRIFPWCSATKLPSCPLVNSGWVVAMSI